MLLRAQKKGPLKDKLEREIVIHLKNELLEKKKENLCQACLKAQQLKWPIV